MRTRWMALLLAVLFCLVACSDEEEDGPLVGTWKGPQQLSEDPEIHGIMTVVLGKTAFQMEARLTNQAETLVHGAKGTYTATESVMVMTETSEYKITNVGTYAGHWIPVSPPDVSTNAYVLDGNTITVTTPEPQVFVLVKQ